MTSEQKLGLMKQPAQTCPEIDKNIKKVNDIITYAKEIQRTCENKDIIDLAGDIEWLASDLPDGFEYCRSQCEDIRSWGQEWKDTAKELIEYYEPEKLAEGESNES